MKDPEILYEHTRYERIGYCQTPESFMKEFRYKTIHIPSEKSIEKSIWCTTRKDFLSLLDYWNEKGKNVYKYHSIMD